LAGTPPPGPVVLFLGPAPGGATLGPAVLVLLVGVGDAGPGLPDRDGFLAVAAADLLAQQAVVDRVRFLARAAGETDTHGRSSEGRGGPAAEGGEVVARARSYAREKECRAIVGAPGARSKDRRDLADENRMRVVAEAQGERAAPSPSRQGGTS